MKTKEQAAQEYADNIIKDHPFNTSKEAQASLIKNDFLAGVEYANKWEDGETPPGKEDFPKHNNLQCLIVRKDRGYVEMAYYDFHYHSWNDSDNDDHLCDTEQVKKWKPIEL